MGTGAGLLPQPAVKSARRFILKYVRVRLPLGAFISHNPIIVQVRPHLLLTVETVSSPRVKVLV